jgi:hypothetical protein
MTPVRPIRVDVASRGYGAVTWFPFSNWRWGATPARLWNRTMPPDRLMATTRHRDVWFLLKKIGTVADFGER